MACGAHCFVPWGSVGDTATTNVNGSNSCFCVCLIYKTSSVLCQRQWWAVLSLPVLSGHGCSVLAQYQWFCHDKPEAGGYGGCPFSRSWWVQHCWISQHPEGRECPSTVTLLGAFLMLMSGWMAVFCRSRLGKRHIPGQDVRKFRRWDSRKQFCDPELQLVEKLCLFLFLLWLCVGKGCV